MINNETMQSILSRRSYKIFDGRPIGDEELDTILTAGLYAPTGMNGQPWHFTVVKSKEMLQKIGDVMKKLPRPAPPPGMTPPPGPMETDPMRNAPVLIIVSGRESHPTNFEDCCLAMENMFIAAASLGIASGWVHAIVKDFFNHPEGMALKPWLVPEGYVVRAAAFFGYPGPYVKDRGPRKGTISYV